MEDTEFVKAGAYHTLELEPQRPFDITKQSWDVLDLERLRQACDPSASADLAAVLITVTQGPLSHNPFPSAARPPFMYVFPSSLRFSPTLHSSGHTLAVCILSWGLAQFAPLFS